MNLQGNVCIYSEYSITVLLKPVHFKWSFIVTNDFF